MKRSPYTKTAPVAVLLAVIVSVGVVQAEGEKYFVTDSLRGVLHPHYPSNAFFHSGKHDRTYVTYMDSEHNARVIYYDHGTGQWSESVRVDDCRYKDGHNEPVLFVSSNGFVHLFYGCHGDPIKYARTLYPERIDRWRLGQEFGESATYPHPVELSNGDILVFYRRRSRYVAVQRTCDNGSSWGEHTHMVDTGPNPDLVNPGPAYRTYMRQVIYDPSIGRVHMVFMRWPDRRPYDSARTRAYYVQYDPETGHSVAIDGTDSGELATPEKLIACGSVLTEEEDGGTDVDIRMRLVNGVPYFIFLDKGGRYFGTVKDGQIVKWDLPAEMQALEMYSKDGITWEMYGPYHGRESEIPGLDLAVWTSTDGGHTWDDGRIIVSRDDLGASFKNCNLVDNYAGTGPFLIFQTYGGQATAEFEAQWEIRSEYKIEPIPVPLKRRPLYAGAWNYDAPARKNKPLYALDAQYQFIANP